ncbi:DUF1217 domain-containing protein [Mangrovicella endophytica]|uniref:DUF1217 domain-containing protein n=1 Tax=Mangrovicella endophytica TaxID=2066697 RepID=UPI000C9E1003|nr:DUF1217 domain-containing protein [Mangrovicella endophytica]
MLSAAANYALISRDLSTSLTRTSKEPAVERASEDYLSELSKVTSIDDFLKNDKVYRFAMKAFGLEDMTYAKGFMRKVLTEGVTSSDSFANKLTDKRYREFATAFNFAVNGADTTKSDVLKQPVVAKYLRQTMEENAGATNEGTRLALYFERKATTITSAFSILADKALLQVVQTAFNIPATTSSMDIDKQAAMIEKRLDVADLKDPAKLKKFIGQFLAMYDMNTATSNPAAANPALALFTGSSGGIGIDTSVLLTLQTYRNRSF